MIKNILVLIISLTIMLNVCIIAKDNGSQDNEVTAIKKVIESAYVKGIHINRDTEAIKKGFHPQFNMLVLGEDGNMVIVPIAKWIEKIEAGKKKNPEPLKVTTTHKFASVDVTGDAAVAKIQVFKDSKHVFTDYMSLYKFKDGWKIVNKIFQKHL